MTSERLRGLTACLSPSQLTPLARSVVSSAPVVNIAEILAETCFAPNQWPYGRGASDGTQCGDGDSKSGAEGEDEVESELCQELCQELCALT